MIAWRQPRRFQLFFSLRSALLVCGAAASLMALRQYETRWEWQFVQRAGAKFDSPTVSIWNAHNGSLQGNFDNVASPKFNAWRQQGESPPFPHFIAFDADCGDLISVYGMGLSAWRPPVTAPCGAVELKDAVASIGAEGRLVVNREMTGTEATVWKPNQQTPLVQRVHCAKPFHQAYFSTTGRLLLLETDSSIECLEVEKSKNFESYVLSSEINAKHFYTRIDVAPNDRAFIVEGPEEIYVYERGQAYPVASIPNLRTVDCAWSADSRLIALADAENEEGQAGIRVVDASTFEVVMQTPLAWCHGVKFDHSGKHVIATSPRGWHIVAADTGRLVHECHCDSRCDEPVRVSADSEVIAYLGEDSIDVWRKVHHAIWRPRVPVLFLIAALAFAACISFLADRRRAVALRSQTAG
jgi:hypothetical protein